MNLGVKIKELRKSHDLSQDAFAELFNVTRQTVSNWENQKSYPDLETIVTISQEFNTTVDELLKEDATFVKQIDGEKKKKNILSLILISLSVVLVIGSFLTYRYIQVANLVAFTMKNDQTLQLEKAPRETLEITNGYFSLPRSGKVTLNAQGNIDSGILTIIISNHNGQTVYQIAGDSINDRQTLQLEKGSYDIQITANDATEATISLAYDLAVSNQ